MRNGKQIEDHLDGDHNLEGFEAIGIWAADISWLFMYRKLALQETNVF